MKTKSKKISERVWHGEQSWCFERIEEVGGHRLRTKIRHNAYDFQSYARIDRWDGAEWKTLHTIPGQSLKLYPYVVRETPNVAKVFESDATELMRVALAVLS